MAVSFAGLVGNGEAVIAIEKGRVRVEAWCGFFPRPQEVGLQHPVTLTWRWSFCVWKGAAYTIRLESASGGVCQNSGLRMSGE
jgi:hypothetical protein